jgi:hypothetical protein
MIELITCDSGDWDVLKVNGKIFFEGHEIPDHVWLDLLQTKFAIPCKGYAISDDAMENRTFESEVDENE